MPQGIEAVISRAAFEEQSWYTVGGLPVIMKVHVDKFKTKSVGGAFVEVLVGLQNKNEIKANIRLVDRASGGEVRAFKVKASEELDKALSIGDVAKGILSFSDWGALALAFGGGANRNVVGEKMAENLMAVALAELQGKPAAKAVVKAKKTAAKLAKASGLPIPRFAPGAVLAPELLASSVGPANAAIARLPPVTPVPMIDASAAPVSDPVTLAPNSEISAVTTMSVGSVGAPKAIAPVSTESENAIAGPVVILTPPSLATVGPSPQ